MHSYLTSLLPGEAETDDILQHANLILWEKRDEFEAGTSFKSWALAVTYWEARSWMKRRKRSSWLLFNDELARTVTSHFTDQADPSPSSSAKALRICLGKLRAKDRLLVLSHYQHGKSLRECSRIFDRSADSLKTALYRIRGVLRQCIRGELARDQSLT